MEYAFESTGGNLSVRLGGRMTHADYKGFRDILGRILGDRPQRVVFDLARVEFVDSSALGMLLIVRDAAIEDRREVVLKGAAGQVEKLVRVAKLHKYFTVE
ncbi:MAG: STAS domain-containing protein [Magnetospirillum sp.]|nr:STAS domain-containing protein [Magnetospirillum sp.]